MYTGGLTQFAELVVRAATDHTSANAFRLKCWVGKRVCATVRMKLMVEEIQANPTKSQSFVAQLVAQHVARVAGDLSAAIERFQNRIDNRWTTDATGWDVSYANKAVLRRVYVDRRGGYHQKDMANGCYIMFVDTATGTVSFNDPFGSGDPMWSMDVGEITGIDQYATHWQPCERLGMFASLPALLAAVKK